MFVLILILFSVFSTPSLFSQAANKAVVLVQGRVLDYQTKEGVSTGVEFVDKNGKKIQTRSSAGTGAFQQVLNPNENYIVMFKDYLLMNESKRYLTPAVTEYHETQKDFHVRKIVTGMDLFHFQAFNPNESTITDETVGFMNELKEMLMFNPKVNVIIRISTGDSYFKPFKKKITEQTSKKKSKSKSITVTSEEQLKELAVNRIATIKEYMRKNSFPERLATFESEIKSSPAPTAKTKTSKKKSAKKELAVSRQAKSDNVLVTVGRILNL